MLGSDEGSLNLGEEEEEQEEEEEEEEEDEEEERMILVVISNYIHANCYGTHFNV